MKNVKVIVVSVILALIVYGLFLLFQRGTTSLSPIPEKGIKVIQISPGDQ